MIVKLFDIKMRHTHVSYSCVITSTGLYAWDSTSIVMDKADRWKLENGKFYVSGPETSDYWRDRWTDVGDHPIKEAFKQMMHEAAEEELFT